MRNEDFQNASELESSDNWIATTYNLESRGVTLPDLQPVISSGKELLESESDVYRFTRISNFHEHRGEIFDLEVFIFKTDHQLNIALTTVNTENCALGFFDVTIQFPLDPEYFKEGFIIHASTRGNIINRNYILMHLINNGIEPDILHPDLRSETQSDAFQISIAQRRKGLGTKLFFTTLLICRALGAEYLRIFDTSLKPGMKQSFYQNFFNYFYNYSMQLYIPLSDESVASSNIQIKEA